MKNICQLFGTTPSTCSRNFRQAEEALLQTLLSIPEARISWPTIQEQIQMAYIVEQKDPLIKGRWGFLDGKKYKIPNFNNINLRLTYYNSWFGSCCISGVLCYAADGCIVWARHNFPGTWHDSDVSRDFQRKICDPRYNADDHGVLADSAFPTRGPLFKRIITSLKRGDIMKSRPQYRPFLRRISRSIVSMRQAAEWGQGSPLRCYRKLLLKLPVNSTKRGRILNIIHHLYNFRVRMTGISQIKTYFYGFQ